MSNSVFAVIFCATAILFISGCGDASVRRTEIITSAPTGGSATAGPGDTVLDIRVVRPLPNAFGKADVFGRTTDAGRVVVRYIGSHDGMAVFTRQDLLIDSNETTMSRTPLLIPSISTTTTSGVVGGTPFSAQQSAPGYIVVPPRPSQRATGALDPITLRAQAGAHILVEGHKIEIYRVESDFIQYVIRNN